MIITGKKEVSKFWMFMKNARIPIEVPHLHAPPEHPGEENLAKENNEEKPDIDP
jgi:hypothetical protein